MSLYAPLYGPLLNWLLFCPYYGLPQNWGIFLTYFTPPCLKNVLHTFCHRPLTCSRHLISAVSSHFYKTQNHPKITNNESQNTLKIDNNFPLCLCKSCFACFYFRQGVCNVGEEKDERRALDYNWQWGNSNCASLGRTSPSE